MAITVEVEVVMMVRWWKGNHVTFYFFVYSPNCTSNVMFLSLTSQGLTTMEGLPEADGSNN